MLASKTTAKMNDGERRGVVMLTSREAVISDTLSVVVEERFYWHIKYIFQRHGCIPDNLFIIR